MGVRDYILKANNEFVKSGEATPMRTETADYLVADLWGHYRGAQDIMTEKQVLGPIYNKYGIRPRDFYEEYTTTKLTHDELQRQTDELADRIKGVRKDIRNIKKDETTGRISTEDAQAARENATRATEELKMVAMAHKTDPVNIELKRKFNEMTKAMEFIDNSRRLWGVSEVLPERYNKDGSIKRWGTVLYQVVPEFNEAGDITGYTKVKYADSKAKAVIHSDTKQRSTRDWLEWKDRYHIEESKEHPGYWWMDEIDAHGNTVLDAETGLRKQVLVEKREFDGWKDRNGRQSRFSIAEKAIRDYLEQGDYSNTNTDKLLNDLNTQRKVLLKDEDLGDIDFIPIPEEFGEIPSYIEKLKNNRLTAKDAAEFFGRVLKGVHLKQLRFDLPSYNFNHGGNILAETPMKESLKQYRNSVNLSIERIANAIGMGRVLSTASEVSLALGLKGMGETNVARYINGLIKDLTYTPTNLNVFNTGRFRVGDFEFKPGKVVDIGMALPSTAVMAFNVKSAINNMIYGLRTFSYADIQAGRFWRHYADIPKDFAEGLVRNTGKIIKNIGDYEGGLAKYGREVEQRANGIRNDPIRETVWKKMEKAEMLEGFFEDIQNKTAFDKYQYHSLSFQRFTENLLRQRMAQRGLNAFMDLYPFAKSGLTPEAYSDLALSQIRTNLWENAGYVSPMELPATLRKMAKNPYMNATLRLLKYAAEDITNSLTRITMALKGNVYGEGRSKYLAQLASMAFVGTIFGGLKSVPGYQDAVSFLNYMSSSASKMDEDNPPPILNKPMVRALWDYGYKTIAEPLGISRGQWEDTRNILEEGFLATITGIPINATPLRFGDIYNPAGVSIWFQAVAKGGKSTEGFLGALTTILYYSVFPKGGRLMESALRQLAAGEHLYPMEKGGGIIEGHGKFGVKDFVRALISTNNIEGNIESNRKFMEGRLAMSSPVQKRDFLKGAIGSYTTLDTRMTGAKDKIVYKTDFWKHVPEMTDRYFEYVGRHREEISEANDILDEYMSMHEAELRQLANKNVTDEIPASWNESKEKDLKQQLKQYLSDFYVKMATRDALISTYEKHKAEFAKDKKNDILMLINKDNLGEPDDKIDSESMTTAGATESDKGPKKAFAYALSKLAGKQKQFDKLK
jgi:hypothetical protein